MVLVKDGCKFLHYQYLDQMNCAGYAMHYLQEKWDYLLFENNAKLDVYKILFRIDQRLGTTSELQLLRCFLYPVNINIIEFFREIEIDYEFQEETSGTTIFMAIFQLCRYLAREDCDFNRALLETNKFRKLLRHVEAIFRKLVQFADFENNPEKMKKILEMTSKSGQALINSATHFCSMEITDYLLKNKININNCDSSFMTAQFNNAEITKRVVKYVNPKIINHQGKSPLYCYPEDFTGSLKTTAKKYPNEIHVAFTDQECPSDCPADCKSKLTAFYYKNGPYIQRNQANRLVHGDLGTVFKGKWHGQAAVFKFIKMNMMNFKVPDNPYNLQPIGHFRQQEQRLDKSSKKYVAENFEVFVFKKRQIN